MAASCACSHSLDDHDGEKGPCRACLRDPDRARCMAFSPTASSATRRDGLRTVSDERAGVNRERSRLQREAWGPPPWTCALLARVGSTLVTLDKEGNKTGVLIPTCRGQVHGHEILSRARAGRTDANLLDISKQLPLCNRHNGWLTQFAEVPGLVERSPRTR